MGRRSSGVGGRLVFIPVLAWVLLAPTGARADGLAVTYHAGWNLVSGPEGTRFAGADGPIFSLQAGDTDYQAFAAGTPAQAGWGYWVYFGAARTVRLPDGVPSAVIDLPAGQWVLAGNPSGSQTLRAAGADALFTFTPGRGYRAVTALQPGQGAWAFSQEGATLTIGVP